RVKTSAAGRSDAMKAFLVRGPALLWFWIGLVFLFVSCPAGAQAPPASAPGSQTQAQGRRSALEESLVAEAAAYHQLELEEHPEGKVVTAIKIYVAPVLDDRDPIPN